jgi:hypothetical protein
MKNVLLKLKNERLIIILVGLIWAWQANSFSSNHNISSPLSLLLPILLLAASRIWLRKNFDILISVKIILASILAFSLANAFTPLAVQVSKIYRLAFRAINIPDYISSNTLNIPHYYFADLWLQFFIFSSLLIALLGLIESNFSWKATLIAGAQFTLAAFFPPLLGNLLVRISGSQAIGIIASFLCLAIFLGKILDEKRQLTIYEI